jgi:hypothetical protein
MKLTQLEIITSLIRVSAIIAGARITISEEDWHRNEPHYQAGHSFIETTWDVEKAGCVSNLGPLRPPNDGKY